MIDPDRQRFGPQFVEEFRAAHAHRAERNRPLTYDIAVLDEYAPWRDWLDAQVALLPPDKADLVSGRIWQERQHWPTLFELATGATLRAVGLQVAYEQKRDGLTPDWTVEDEAGAPLAFVEVHTDQPDPFAYGQIRAWRDLSFRLGQIEVPVVLFIERGPRKAPDAAGAKRIARDVRTALESRPMQTKISSEGYVLLVQGLPGGGVMRAANGRYTEFASPTPIAGPVNARQLTQRIDAKVSRYRALAEKYRVPLVAAVGAHKFTGVGLPELRRMLEGDMTMTWQFNYGDYDFGKAIQVDWGHPPRWSMPPDLAGVLWISNEFPFNPTALLNLEAKRAVPQALVLLAPLPVDP